VPTTAIFMLAPFSRCSASGGLGRRVGHRSAALAQPAQTIYVGGDILTMKGSKPAYAQALAIRFGSGKAFDGGRVFGEPHHISPLRRPLARSHAMLFDPPQ
jgi:hypothetical protein